MTRSRQEPSSDLMGAGSTISPIICQCKAVSEDRLIAAIAAGCRDVDALRRETGACTTCGDCLADLEELLDEFAPSGQVAAQSDGTGRPGVLQTASRGPEQPSGAECQLAAYLEDLAAAAKAVDLPRLTALASLVESTIRDGGNVLIAGNGGSATTSAHIAADWSSASHALRSRSLFLALADNVARLTAIANDIGYDDVFSHQVDRIGRPGDLLVVLSVGGRSPNLVAAVHRAVRLRMNVAAVLGRPAEISRCVPTHVIMGGPDYGLAEDLQLSVGHMVVRLLTGGPHACDALTVPQATAALSQSAPPCG